MLRDVDVGAVEDEARRGGEDLVLLWPAELWPCKGKDARPRGCPRRSTKSGEDGASPPILTLLRRSDIISSVELRLTPAGVGSSSHICLRSRRRDSSASWTGKGRKCKLHFSPSAAAHWLPVSSQQS